MHRIHFRQAGLELPLRIMLVFMALVLSVLESPPVFSGEIRNKVNDATVPNIPITTLAGDIFRIEDLNRRGTAVLLNFWGLRCDACIQELPHLNDIARKYQDRVAVFGINTDGVDGPTLKEFMGELEIRIDFPVVPDPEFTLMDGFKLNTAPLTILIDPGRNVRYRHEGYELGQENELEEVLKTALGTVNTNGH